MRILFAIIAVTALCASANASDLRRRATAPDYLNHYASLEQGTIRSQRVHVFRLSSIATQRICGANIAACTQRWGEGAVCNVFVSRGVNAGLVSRGLESCQPGFADAPLMSETVLLESQ